MSLTITRASNAHGQVEAIKMAFKGTRGIYSQLPCADALDNVENGMFLKYDRGAGNCNTTSEYGEWLMVYDEVVLVEYGVAGHHQYTKDFVLRKEDFHNGKIYPRLVTTTLGDHMITNQVPDGSYDEGDLLVPTIGADTSKGAMLTKTTAETVAGKTNVWKVDRLFTLADGTPALGLTRVQ